MTSNSTDSASSDLPVMLGAMGAVFTMMFIAVVYYRYRHIICRQPPGDVYEDMPDNSTIRSRIRHQV